MRRLLTGVTFSLFLAMSFSAVAATGKVIKVLPHFLDQQGRHALSPSLYDRDAYQAKLRKNPELRSALRFDILWRAQAVKDKLKLKVELRGTPKGDQLRATTLENQVQRGQTATHWTAIKLEGDDFKNFGEVTAWRVTLWDGEQLVGEEKSFLW